MEASKSGVARHAGRILGSLVAWGWTILSGGGGLELILTEGPWPLTNGWFALFSGLAACPTTAWLLKKYVGVRFPGWIRFIIALSIILMGRLALKIEGRAGFLPNFNR
jgi:hypothetical protein